MIDPLTTAALPTAALPTAFIQNIRGQELLLIFLVVLLLFGAKRLPELFRSLGKSIKEFKKATSDIEEDVRSAMETEDAPGHRSKTGQSGQHGEGGQNGGQQQAHPDTRTAEETGNEKRS